jgi:hypothetical protein
VAAPNGYILSVHDRDLTPLGERQLQLPIRIGRSSLNDVPVAHGLVSEFHARVEEIDGKLCVRDLNSKNGVLVEALGAEAARIPAHLPVDLEPYGFEFSLSPLLRVRLRPAPEGAPGARHNLAVGRVLGNPSGVIHSGPAFAEDKLTEVFIPQPAAFGSLARGSAPASVQRPPLLTPAQGIPSEPPRILPRPSTAPAPPRELPRRTPAYVGGGPPSASAAVLPYASVFIEPTSAPLELPAAPRSLPPLDPVPARPERRTRPAPPLPRAATVPEPAVRAPQPTAWEVSPNGTLPGAAPVAAADAPEALGGITLEALALRGLRELAASLLPGQPVESAADIIQLVTKVHDALEMFCRCFVPVREACSRFIDPDELERAAAERCQSRSPAYLAVERALEPREVASALLSFRDGAEDAPSAVEHILADLMLQQLALVEGALDGTRALLDELSPTRLEAHQPQPETILSRLAGNRERALWDTFRERHARLGTDRVLLSELFGASFSRAYLARVSGR